MLFAFLPKVLIPRYEVKLKQQEGKQGYWQVISEIRTAVIFHHILSIPVQNIDVKTVKEKNVDISAVFSNEEIHIEVKGFTPEEEKIARQGGFVDSGEVMVDRALRKAQKKFLKDRLNIVVIADEDILKTPLYMNPFLELKNVVDMYLDVPDYKKTVALMVLGGYYEEQMLKFKIWYSQNTFKTMPVELVERFKEKF